ncbi:hypothetical protein MBLNU459_g1628t1 [Dothideomycetes sp. NU459]
MTLNIVEANIADLQAALSSGAITSVELVSRYLQRISTYDARGPCLNSIPILNPAAFDEAAESDARRAVGQLRGPLDGIPYTLKDSMKYKGVTCASGSEAFLDLVANEDCFVAAQLRQAGAVCIGRTNTPPMMASGMHRGAHGRAESPYNLEYLTAAFSSGSSNGSATSTAASFAAFGLGSETVSSEKEGNFWLEQPFVDIERTKIPKSFPALTQDAKNSLHGKVIAVPKMFIGGHDENAQPIVVSQDVINLWQQTRTELEALGATVKETDFPLVTNYDYNPVTDTSNNVVGLPDNWNGIERSTLVSYAWDDFLATNKDPKYPGLGAADGTRIFPRPENYVPDKFAEIKNVIDYPGLAAIARARDRKQQPTYAIPGMAEALRALEAQRKRDLEDWMDARGVDLVAFPANGDVGRADVDTNEMSARHALMNGVRYSHGNRAIRHMGVPTVSVCMGMMETSRMPVGLTFAGKSGQDAELLRYAYAFEQKTRKRFAPPVTPPLPSDAVETNAEETVVGSGPAVQLVVDSAELSSGDEVYIKGLIANASELQELDLEIFVDGKRLSGNAIEWLSSGTWTARAKYTPHKAQQPLYGGVGLVVDMVMVVVLAKSSGRAAGRSILLPQS